MLAGWKARLHSWLTSNFRYTGIPWAFLVRMKCLRDYPHNVSHRPLLLSQSWSTIKCSLKKLSWSKSNIDNLIFKKIRTCVLKVDDERVIKTVSRKLFARKVYICILYSQVKIALN